MERGAAPAPAPHSPTRVRLKGKLLIWPRLHCWPSISTTCTVMWRQLCSCRTVLSDLHPRLLPVGVADVVAPAGDVGQVEGGVCVAVLPAGRALQQCVDHSAQH